MRSTGSHRSHGKIGADAAVGPIQRSSGLAEEVYDAIFSQLMALRIAPGSRITVDNLVRELNVSQTPIREALGRLEGEGLVVKTHLVGYSAAPQITRRRFDELYELRLLLEPDATRRTAHRIDADGLAALRGTAGVMMQPDAADERARYSTFARQDAVFHDTILAIAGNELIRETLAHQHTHFHIFRLMFHTRVTEEALDEHDAILAAFENRDEQAAEQAMRRHIERSRDRLLPAFD
ncbi:GntR family transcriptional regulator [Chthonobacter rhizosphaerae]|uniref:GntR family transcriptional regulator n=1 Tax=Chthonobacter rhizosphaerae TaxID=2735553 RepID=UPI0015EE5BB4|nr:GntR family transcriptional regulator [Chthonobacter rhizosphaerae]